MAGSPQFPNLAARQPFRLPTRPAPRPARNPETAPGHSCAMDTQPCFKALSGIGRVRRFGGTAGGLSTRFRGFEDRFRKSGAFCTWLCCVLLIGLGVSTSAIAQTTVTYIHTDALGSVVAESDANGNVIKRYEYEPYGAVVGGEVTDGPGYAGHAGQFNRYRYASSNPYRFVDPDGRRDKIKAQAAKSVDMMCAASAQGGLPCAD